MLISSTGGDAGRHVAFAFERRDCTVRALALFAGLSYLAAHQLMALAGRKDGGTLRGVHYRPVMDRYGEHITTARPRTLQRFLREHPSGAFLLEMRGHVVAVIDGRIEDLCPLPARCLVKSYWQKAFPPK